MVVLELIKLAIDAFSTEKMLLLLDAIAQVAGLPDPFPNIDALQTEKPVDVVVQGIVVNDDPFKKV